MLPRRGSADRRQFREVTINAPARHRSAAAPSATSCPKRASAGRRLARAGRRVALPSREHRPAVSWDGGPEHHPPGRAATNRPPGSTVNVPLQRGTARATTDVRAWPPTFATRDEAGGALAAHRQDDGRRAHRARASAEHDGAPARNFNGIVGRPLANWDITAEDAPGRGLRARPERYRAAHRRPRGQRPLLHRPGVAGHVQDVVQPPLGAHAPRVRRTSRPIDDSAAPTRSSRCRSASTGTRRTIAVSGYIRNERRTSSIHWFDYRANVFGAGRGDALTVPGPAAPDRRLNKGE